MVHGGRSFTHVALRSSEGSDRAQRNNVPLVTERRSDGLVKRSSAAFSRASLLFFPGCYLQHCCCISKLCPHLCCPCPSFSFPSQHPVRRHKRRKTGHVCVLRPTSPHICVILQQLRHFPTVILASPE